MTIINHKEKKSYENVSKAAAANMILVSWPTIHKWSKLYEMKTHKHFTIYFNTELLKQPARNKNTSPNGFISKPL